MAYNDLQETDTVIVNSGENSYSATVEQVAAGTNLATTDVLLVNRGESSYSVTVQQLSDEIGARGEITPPVVVLTPPNGAGMAGEDVTPAAEGITGVVETTDVGPKYSDNLTSDNGNFGQPAANAFDGDISSSADSDSWGGTLTFPTNLTVEKSLRVYRSGNVDAGDPNQPTISVNGGPSRIFPYLEWLDLNFTGNLTSLFIADAAGSKASLSAVEIDGKILIDNDTANTATLTYTTDNNLSLLAAGQSMTQQPAYTPVTDKIIGVSTDVLDLVPPTSIGGTSAAPVFDGNNATFVNVDITAASAGSLITTFSPAIPATREFVLYQANVDLEKLGYELAQGFRINGIDVNAERQFVASDPSDDFRTTNKMVWNLEELGIESIFSFDMFYTQRTPATENIYGFRADDILLTNSTQFVEKTLTLDSPKDIVNFRPGDVVQTIGTGNAAWNETQVWSSYLSTDFTLNNPGQCFDGLTNTYGEAWNGSYDNVNTIPPYNLEFIPPTPIEGPVEVWSVASGAGIYRNRWQVDTGSGYSATTYVTQNTWVEVVPAGQSLVKYQQLSDANGTSFSAIKANGKILVDPTTIYSVVSTDVASSKLTVDGGAWSDDSDAIVYSDGGDDDELYRFSWKDTFAAGALNYTGNAWVREDPATFTLPDSVSGTLTIYAGGTGSSEGTVTANINGVTSTVTFNNSSEKDTFTNFTVTGGESIVFTPTGIGAFIVAMDLDGSRLVDPEGQTQVTGLTYQGTGDYVSHTANTLELTNAGGRWCVDEQSIGLKAESDDTYTDAAPGWDSTTFQSANGLDKSIEFDGESCVLREVKWTIEESSGDKDGPWENTTEYTDFVSVEINQEVPPLNQEVTLTPGKFHRVKVQYTADSGADPVESDWNYFKASEDEKPQGVRMSGLRFDSARSTFMSRSSTQSTTYTWSGWFKLTSAATNSCLFSLGEAGAKGSARVGVDIATNGQLIYLANPNVSISGFTADLNKWYHLVMQVDSAVKFYVDGVLINSSSSPYSEEDFNFTCIGAIASETSADQFNGYMSDVYFVDGQALEPSDFGKFYEGLWGPIPSETILNNITRSESPYDQRPNMDEEWSAAVSLSGTDGWAQGPELAFDGVVSATDNSTSYVTNGRSGTVVTMSFNTPVTINNKIEIFLTDSALANDSTVGYKFELDGAERLIESSDGPGWGKGWIDLGDSFVGKTIANTTPLIQSVSKGSPQVWLSAIRVDGRILIDGPANNSQNWSDGLKYTDGTSVQNPANAFNGDPANGAGGDNKEITWTVPIGTLSGTIETYSVKTSGESTTNLVKLFDSNGNLITSSDSAESGGGYTQTFPDVTGVKKITIYQKGSGLQVTGLHYIKLDNKFLVDGGTQWNTSEIWSEGGSVDLGYGGATGESPSYAFDGKFDTAFSVANTGTMLLNFDNLEVTSSLRIYAYGRLNGGNVIVNEGEANEQTIALDTSNATKWYSIDGFTGDLKQIKISNPLSVYNSVYAVEVDGKILVDPGSVGNNGFFLPFDPAQEGVIYSQYITGELGTSTSSYTHGFDGDLTSSVIGASGLTYTIPPGVGGTLEIHTSPVAQAITLNGVEVISSSAFGWNTIGTVSEGDTIALTGGASGDGAFEAMKIDGKWLLDHNNIGVDASGNGNNFHDENFAVGNTSEVWSSQWSGLSYTAAGYDKQSMFANTRNGDTPALNETLTWNPVGVTFTDKLTVDLNSGSAAGGTFVAAFADGTSVTFKSEDLGSRQNYVLKSGGGTLTNVTNTGGNSNSKLIIMWAWYLDGEMMIDANIQDTVVDTPVKSYAVLGGYPNGGLKGAADSTGVISTIAGTTGVKYYYETSANGNSANSSTNLIRLITDIDTASSSGNCGIRPNGSRFRCNGDDMPSQVNAGDIFGITWEAGSRAFSVYLNGAKAGDFVANDGTIVSVGAYIDSADTINQVYNFGQQPFAGSNVTHDLNAGTVVIDGITYDTLYEELEGYQVAGGYFYDEKNQRAVRGSDLRKRFGITSADPQLGIYDLTEVPSHQVIGYEKVGSKYQALRDYTPEVRTAQAETTAVTAELTEAQATITAQRQMIIRAACTWVVGKAYEEGDIILFNGHVFKALTATTATADNDPGDETGDWEFLGLEEDTAPTVIDGYYPLYTTEAASNAAGNGSSHTHTFDGVTYYMPNGGTTIYHGTYTGYSY